MPALASQEMRHLLGTCVLVSRNSGRAISAQTTITREEDFGQFRFGWRVDGLGLGVAHSTRD